MVFKSTLLICTLLLSIPAHAANSISAGQIQFDPQTPHSIAFNLPYSGDDNNNAVAEVRYKTSGSYVRGYDMLRVTSGQFAGSIVDLNPGVSYDIQIQIIDPDGGSQTLDLSGQTRRLPLNNPGNPNVINVSNQSQLNSAVSNAQPGDVILIQNGTYSGPLILSQAGTETNPIIVRGESQSGVIIQLPEVNRSGTYCDGASVLEVRASHNYVENITFKGEMWGARLGGSGSYEDIVVRSSSFTGNHCGINASGGTGQHFYICDNVLEGKFTNADTGRDTWGVEGILITGLGHTMCHNTLSGYGDTIDIPNYGDNRSMDIFGNDILWGGDDALELDGGERNIRAYRNRISNSGTGISVQPGGGGPFYIFRNIIYNSGLEYLEGGQLEEVFLPFKIKNGASGLYLFHNTTLRPGPAWEQGESLENTQVLNNLFLGTSGGTSISAENDSIIDYNGYNSGSPYGNNGVSLGSNIFNPSDQILSSGATDWRPYYEPGPLTLNSQSAAVNAGISLPNFNDASNGSPDLGAIEVGQALVEYGSRTGSGNADPGPDPDPVPDPAPEPDPVPSPDSGLQNDTLAAMPDKTWLRIDKGALATNSGILAYSGMALDTVNRQLLVFGGGHWDYVGNEVWALDLNTLTWNQMYNPTCGNPAFPGTRHSYDTTEFIPSIGEMYIQGKVGWYGDCDGELGTWTYNFATNSWTNRNSGGPAPSGDGAATAYDPINDVVWHIAEYGTWKYDPHTGNYTQVNTSGTHNGTIELGMTYDANRHVLWAFGSEYPSLNDLWMYDIANNKWTNVSHSGDVPSPSGGYGLAFDAANDVLLVFNSGTLWSYNPNTSNWTQENPSARPPNFGRIHGDFKYDPVNRVVFLVTGTPIETWAYRYGSGVLDSMPPAKAGSLTVD